MSDNSDTYKPRGKEINKAVKKQGLFSGGFAQGMVLLNGILLTLTAYAALNVFVKDMKQEHFVKLTTEVEHEIADSFSDLENSFYTLGVFASLSMQSSVEELRREIQNVPFDISTFDFIYMINRSPGQDWSVIPLFEKEGVTQLYEDFVLKPDMTFAEYVHGLAADKKDIVQFLGNVKGVVSTKDNNNAIVRPVALIRALESDDNAETYIAGFVQIHNTIEMAGGYDAALVSLDLTYANNFMSLPLYKYVRGAANSQEKNIKSQDFRVQIAGQELSGSLSADSAQGIVFINQVPLLILIFGVSLTVIGTLYVRNNQMQSIRLASMNKALAQKNYDLNTQVKERERLNNALERAEKENRSILNSVSDIIFEINRNGEILFLNETWKTVTGNDVEEAMDKNLFDFFHVQDKEEQVENFKKLAKGDKKKFRSIARLKERNDEYRSIELSASVLKEKDDIRIVGTMTDIEERRRAEMALSEAERKYRTIVENVAGGIYQLTGQGQYLSANPAMAKILGYDTPQDLLSSVRNANEDLYSDVRRRMKYLREREDFRDTAPIEMEMARKDGQKIWVSESARAVFDDADKLLFFEGSVTDITQQKEAEMKLKEAKIASDLANRAKSEFLTNMSHELRTPLNSIIGFSEIIENEAFGPVGSPEYSEYAQNIHEGGKRLLKVINEILDVSHIDTGNRVLNEGVINLNKVVNSCLDLLEPKIEANDMRVKNNIAPNFPQLVAEELAVKQMLMNLLSNAVKFTQAGGHITIDAEIGSQGSLTLSVTDTGAGLDEHEITKALSPFGQIDSAHSKSNAGTGLGLTLVDSLIKMHQGRLELFSQKGVGTTASLVFPERRVTRGRADKDALKENTVVDFTKPAS